MERLVCRKYSTLILPFNPAIKCLAPQVAMEALPSSWDGDLIMVDHMAGFVSERHILSVLLEMSFLEVIGASVMD